MDDALSTEPPCLEHRWAKETWQEELLSHRRRHQKNCHRKVQKYLWLIFSQRLQKRLAAISGFFNSWGSNFWPLLRFHPIRLRTKIFAGGYSYFFSRSYCERQFRSWSRRNKTRRSLLGRYRLDRWQQQRQQSNKNNVCWSSMSASLGKGCLARLVTVYRISKTFAGNYILLSDRLSHLTWLFGSKDFCAAETKDFSTTAC